MSDAHTTAALLIIGDEVLSGKVDDLNGPFLIRALRERGVQVVEQRIIGDGIESIVAGVRELSARADHLFTTGGIGPTHDDRTIEAVARAYDTTVVRHPELERRLVARYGEPLPPARARLAEVPQSAEVILDPSDALPVIRVGTTWVFPGVPSLMRICFARMADRIAGAPFFSEALFLDASESLIAPILTAAQSDHPAVSIGSYPRFDGTDWRVKVTVDGRDRGAVDVALARLRRDLNPAWITELSG